MDTAIDKVSQWLVEKVGKVNPLNSRANAGFKTLRGVENYETRMNSFVFAALQIMLQRFGGDANGVPKGQAKLTELSATVGKVVTQMFTDQDMSTYKLLPLGDAFIGAFHSLGYVNIYRDAGYSEWDSSAPYVAEVTDTFHELGELPELLEKDLLRATSPTLIKKVSGMLQESGRSVIKDYKEDQIQDLTIAIKEDLPWIKSLNKMQRTGWKINNEVLNVVNANKDMLIKPVPPRPGLGSSAKVATAFAAMKKDPSNRNVNKYNKESALWNAEVASLKIESKNVEVNVILKKAEALKDMDSFYQYVDLDYRGRAYYQEPFLNYQGSDLARGLFLFSEGKPLGDSGRKWLEIHTASCFNQSYNKNDIPAWCTHDYKKLLTDQKLESISVDKMTLEDRAQWTKENLNKILEDADKIVKCEKPILYLACCIEWKNLLDNPDHLSHLPIPIDGSCNGYQHSGAIAKDEITGSLVSLTDTDIQGDLYVTAAKELIKRKTSFFAARPSMKMKHIRKGIAKRGVMVRAYSAGKDKIAENMYRDCHTEGYVVDHNIKMNDCLDLGSELYDLIGDVCPGATKTMKYLQRLAEYALGEFKTYENGKELAKGIKKRLHAKKQKLKKESNADPAKLKELNEVSARIANLETKLVRGLGDRRMEWITPTSFRVIYEAFIQRKVKVSSTVPGFKGGAAAQPGRIKHVLLEDTTMPDIRIFQAGIAPNFIHSMDAAHMAYVISEWDGSFGAVHDSFSTHACDVDELAKWTRETFVDLYDVEDPYKEIALRVLGTDKLDFEAPEYGKLDVKEVLKSKYFFC